MHAIKIKPKFKKIDNIECQEVLLEELFNTYYKIKYRFAHNVVVMLLDSCVEIFFTQQPVCACVVVIHSLSCVFTLCDPMNCSMPGLLVLHYLLEFAQTHVH